MIKVIIESFRLGTYIATQFKPVVAKAIYQMTNAKRVLDTSCGWGDRLAEISLPQMLKNTMAVILILILMLDIMNRYQNTINFYLNLKR